MNMYNPQWDEPPYDDEGPDLEIDGGKDGLDPDACGCDDSFIAVVNLVNTIELSSNILYYECIKCGARWHYWEEETCKDTRDIAEVLVEARRKK